MTNSSQPAKKSLGQHWLKDVNTLRTICDFADLKPKDTVLEIGPGMGTLTKELVKRAGQVIAVELDELLARELPYRVPDNNLQIVQADILRFDLTSLPAGYKVVANIPYYLTNNLLRILCESPNPPKLMVLLVQKEVAERVAAKPGRLSLMSVSAQFYCRVELGPVVPAKLFEPPPKVDSQIIKLMRKSKPYVPNQNTKQFFRIVKAGFANRRKTLQNSLSAGLRFSKVQTGQLLKQANINPGVRAQELSLEDWHRLYSLVKRQGKNPVN